MNFPSASPNENMNIDSSIQLMAARRAERSSVAVEILASRLIDDRGLASCSWSWPGASGRPRLFMPRRFKDVGARDKPGDDELRTKDCPINTSAIPITPSAISQELSQEISHARVRSRAAPHGERTTLVEDFVLGERFVIPSRTMTT